MAKPINSPKSRYITEMENLTEIIFSQKHPIDMCSPFEVH